MVLNKLFSFFFVGIFLLSLISASNIISSSYDIGSYSQGIAGGQASSSTYSLRYFMGYEQPGGSASSAFYSAIIGFPPTVNPVVSSVITTPTQTTSPGNSGGGGGAGGAAASVTSVNVSSTFSATLPSVLNNTLNSVNVTNFTGDLVSLSFLANKNLNNVTISIINSSTSAPSFQINSSGSFYQGFDINLTGMNDSDLSKVILNFRVNKTWISKNNLNVSTVALYRNSGNSPTWTKLPTTEIDQDSSYYYFSAVSPGFSIYKIFAESLNLLVNSNPSANSSSFFTSITPTFFRNTLGYIIYYLLLLGVILGIVIISYSLYKRTLWVKLHSIWKEVNKKKK